MKLYLENKLEDEQTIWFGIRDVKYQPETINIVAFGDSRNHVVEKEIHPVGSPHSLVVETDRKKILADKKEHEFRYRFGSR